jgi:hypothetical protein
VSSLGRPNLLIGLPKRPSINHPALPSQAPLRAEASDTAGGVSRSDLVSGMSLLLSTGVLGLGGRAARGDDDGDDDGEAKPVKTMGEYLEEVDTLNLKVPDFPKVRANGAL